MAVLSYRDPVTQEWVPLPVVAGPIGPTGPAGPNAVSVDAGNTAVLGTDSLVYVPVSGGLDQATADTLYVNATGDTVSGPLTVMGALTLAGNPVAVLEATPKQYVDEIVTVSATGPTVPPARDGILWIKVTP